jgi:hypothetical protein
VFRPSRTGQASQFRELLRNRLWSALRTFPYAVAAERLAHRPNLEGQRFTLGCIGEHRLGLESTALLSAVHLGHRHVFGRLRARHRERRPKERYRNGDDQ